MDPLAADYADMSPYNYVLGNPIMLVDEDGKFPIVPILIWAGKRAAAGAIVDVVVQLAVEKYSNSHSTWESAWGALDIDGFQMARSAGENLVKGKYTAAALSSAGDMIDYIRSNDDWTWDGAMLAAGEGALSSIVGDKVGDLVAGAKPGKWNGPTDYSNVKDPKNLNASTKPTPRQVREMHKNNRANNGGVLRDDVTGERMIKSKKSKRGVTPPSNEAQVDHIKSVKKGGTRTNSNLNLRTRKNNRDKWDQ